MFKLHTLIIYFIVGLIIIYGIGCKKKVERVKEKKETDIVKHIVVKKEALHYITKGDRLVNQGKLKEAIVVYKKAIEIQPNYAPAHVNLAVVYEMLHDKENAKKHYEIALKLQPEREDAKSALIRLSK